jgi:hypothetical protein
LFSALDALMSLWLIAGMAFRLMDVREVFAGAYQNHIHQTERMRPAAGMLVGWRFRRPAAGQSANASGGGHAQTRCLSP